MITWGVNALNHDAAIAVLRNDQLIFWERSSTYSGIKGDDRIHDKLRYDAVSHGGPDVIAWYERPWLKKARQFYAGQYEDARDLSVLPSRYLDQQSLGFAKLRYFPHHKTHAAAGFLTSPFDEAAVVVIDAIGEWESASIWYGRGKDLKKVWSISYPHSLGLFYSAFTKLIGYTPIAEEYLLQKDSDQGDSKKYYHLVSEYFSSPMNLKYNLHRGVQNWPFEITDENRCDVAAAVQLVFEDQIAFIMAKAQSLTDSKNLVYMGGCAMNSKANKKEVDNWKGVWSLPIPGDSSSAIGAALLQANCRITWTRDLAKHIELKYNKV